MYYKNIIYIYIYGTHNCMYVYIYISIWIQFLPEKVHHKIILQRLYQKALGRSLSLSVYVCMYVYIYMFYIWAHYGTLLYTPKSNGLNILFRIENAKHWANPPPFRTQKESISSWVVIYIYISHYIPLHQLYIYIYVHPYIYIYPIIFHYVTIVGWESSSWYPHCWGKSQLCTHPM